MLPATRNVDATDSPVYSSSTNDSVRPVSAEYAMNSADAVVAASFCTRADSVMTMPNWAITMPQNRMLLRKMASAIEGELATIHAVNAVIARPPHIQPYTPRKKSATSASSREPAAATTSGRSNVSMGSIVHGPAKKAVMQATGCCVHCTSYNSTNPQANSLLEFAGGTGAANGETMSARPPRRHRSRDGVRSVARPTRYLFCC